MNRFLTFHLLLIVLLITACQPQPTPTNIPPTVFSATETAVSYPAATTTLPISETPELTPTYTYEILNTYPHDPAAFTQGLIYLDGELYEGTGLYGQSSLRQVDLETGTVLENSPIAAEYFGEGITIFDGKIYQLTWQNQTGFIYDQDSFELTGTFSYPTEGWGLTHDGSQLIMSDGTNNLYFLDPDTLEVNGRIPVQDQGTPIVRLNELEYINGEIYANIWQTNKIVRINPETGLVTAWIDLTGLLPPESLTQHADVLNGIAYDSENGRLFVTGKLWPLLFEIKLIETGTTAVAYP